jgi:hypothetical protein
MPSIKNALNPLVLILCVISLSAHGQKHSGQNPLARVNPDMEYLPYVEQPGDLAISRETYFDQLQGFWLGLCIANWTGLVTEMDKIGGAGPHGTFYTREDWGKPDQPSIWGQGIPSDLSPTIDWVLEDEGGTWGADDDTDIEYLYQHLLLSHQTSVLTGEQIRDGWLKHIYSDENTPFINKEGEKENFLWVSNQRAHDLMRTQGMVPPATGDPANNPDYDMIDAQLTTAGVICRPQPADEKPGSLDGGPGASASSRRFLFRENVRLRQESICCRSKLGTVTRRDLSALPGESNGRLRHNITWPVLQRLLRIGHQFRGQHHQPALRRRRLPGNCQNCGIGRLGFGQPGGYLGRTTRFHARQTGHRAELRP